MEKDKILLIGGNKPVYNEVAVKVETLFPNSELVWLRTFQEAEGFFLEGNKARLIFLSEPPADYKGSSFLLEIKNLSKNLPIIFN